MTKNIDVEKIGVGRIAKHFLKAIKKTRDISLTAIRNLNKDKVYNFSKKYNVPFYLDHN